MAKTLYTACGLGDLPPCLICMGPGEGRRRRLGLGFGISIWLCAAHGSEAFLTRRAGRDFVASVWGAWEAAGCLGVQRRRALAAHLARVGQPVDRESRRPGSYAWPALRRDAERRFSAGEDPREVIRSIRGAHRSDVAQPPSARTIRRWFNDARWLAG